MSGQPPEFKQLVLFQSLGEPDVVEIVEAIDRITESLVVLLLDQQIVVCIVDGLDVEL